MGGGLAFVVRPPHGQVDWSVRDGHYAGPYGAKPGESRRGRHVRARGAAPPKPVWPGAPGSVAAPTQTPWTRFLGASIRVVAVQAKRSTRPRDVAPPAVCARRRDANRRADRDASVVAHGSRSARHGPRSPGVEQAPARPSSVGARVYLSMRRTGSSQRPGRRRRNRSSWRTGNSRSAGALRRA